MSSHKGDTPTASKSTNIFNWNDDEAEDSLNHDFTLNYLEFHSQSNMKEEPRGNHQISSDNGSSITQSESQSMNMAAGSRDARSHKSNDSYTLENSRSKASFDSIQKAFSPLAISFKSMFSKSFNLDQVKVTPVSKNSFSSAVLFRPSSSPPLSSETGSRSPNIHESYTLSFSTLSDPDKIMNNIIFDRPYSFNHFKTFDEKEKLLVSAIRTSHSGCIVHAVLFLRETLKQELFKSLLGKYPIVWEEYRYFLKSLGQLDILKITHTKPTLDQLLFDYSSILSKNSESNTLDGLEELLQNYKDYDFYKDYLEEIQQHASLLRSQMTIKEGASEKPPPNLAPPSSPLVGPVQLGDTLIDTTRFLIHQHLVTIPSFPDGIKKQFQLKDIQFEYLVIQVCCHLKNWNLLKKYFSEISKDKLFKMKSSISHCGFENVCRLLKDCDAPESVIEEYLQKIPKIENRISVSESLSLFEYTFNCIVSNREKTMMKEFAYRVPPSNKILLQKVVDSLSDPTIKWKNAS